ncbi:MAG: Carbamate kinase 1 [Elusimicrobia bacterium ADurb.Bin231]|nr:MAG: Carbamate kinase 1 [Elusimicrobia bacterium ADurb.Bin231]
MAKKVAVVAVGGNSLIHDSKHQTVHDQYLAASETMKHIAEMIVKGWDVIITHGNGPQVGFVLARSEYSRGILHEIPLDSCGADTQGAIGYNFQMALGNEFKRRNIKKSAVTVVTQVLVDKNDPSFKKPSKPIGQFYSYEEAQIRKEKDGWDIMEDAGRGWRRVVASPDPKEIIELSAIKTLIDAGVVVVGVGGGGIPVIRDEKGDLKGTSAVIDKDLASSLLATLINADLLLISTAVEKVCLNFGKPDQKSLDRITVAEAKKYIKDGHFKPGSMLPKINAIVKFLEKGGKQALITDPAHIPQALDGKTGTWIIP